MSTDTRDINELYIGLSARLKEFIGRRVSDRAAAEDILHDVFLKVHSHINSLNDSTKIEAWIFQIARNAIIDYYRNRSIPLPIEEDIQEVEQEAVTAGERISPWIRSTIRSMPIHYRNALLLTEYEGLTQKELAEHEGISLSGAKSRVQRARLMLKDLLLQCCHVEFDRYGTVLEYHEIACSCCSKTPC